MSTYRITSNLYEPIGMSSHVITVAKGLDITEAGEYLDKEAEAHRAAGLAVHEISNGYAVVIVSSEHVKTYAIQNEYYAK